MHSKVKIKLLWKQNWRPFSFHENYLELEGSLSTDMTNIENIYIIGNNNVTEINLLNE